MRILRASALVLCVALPMAAVETQVWEHAYFADFAQGSLNKLSLSSNGRLTPGPVVGELYDASTAILWAIAMDSKGNVFAGGGGVGGSKAKLVQIDGGAGGRSKILAELDGMAVQAIAIDKQDRVYAATSPDGKIYRVDSGGKAEVFYDPKTKYIWAMAFAPSGDLFVATGDDGQIHRVTPSGAGSVFYRTEETHVRSLVIDGNGNIIAGTDPSGIVLRISPAGQGFILYEAAKREVTALAIEANGTVFAAVTGIKTAASAPSAPPPQRPADAGTVLTPLPPPPSATAAPAGVPGGSDIFRINTDGYARKVWSHAQDVVFALAFDAQGKPIAGTGNRGLLYRLDSDFEWTRFADLNPSQITALTVAKDGRIFAATGNIGQVFSIGPQREASGTYESPVLDANGFSYWGRITSLTEGNGAVAYETRSGNVSRAQKDWSPWGKLNGDRIISPAARFLQYRATVTGATELYDVTTAYEMKNIAPVVEMVAATPPNYKFPAPAEPGTAVATPATLTLPAIGRAASASGPADAGVNTPALTWSKGQVGVRWLATDENRDTLRFKVEMRGENETTWKPLRANLAERFYSFDSTAFTDGKYRVRITASDAPSNISEQALSSSRESDRFLIDNTPPEISRLAGTVTGTKITVRLHAKDALNILAKAEYSVNGGEWKVVEPTTRITDSEEHDYQFEFDRPGNAPAETTIAVRVRDAFENEAVAKTVVR